MAKERQNLSERGLARLIGSSVASVCRHMIANDNSKAGMAGSGAPSGAACRFQMPQRPHGDIVGETTLKNTKLKQIIIQIPWRSELVGPTFRPRGAGHLSHGRKPSWQTPHLKPRRLGVRRRLPARPSMLRNLWR